MTCDDVRERLDVYLEGGLPHAERAAVAAHLETCAACRAEAHDWRDLFARTAELPRSIDPPRDLWPAIDAELDTARVYSRSFWLIAAAVALVLVTAAVTSFLHREWDSAMARKLKGLESADPSVGAGPTTEELLRSLEAQDLPPETMAIVQRNLAVIDVAIAELEAALERDPGNDELARMLVSTHRKKAELVERAVRVKEDG
jgi:predicted anti-sigma-YlaC factor YlaD